ncbi:MAG: hypothetical protein WC227_01295 [Patescibacteria group bacterium]|jgi:hypothetical protein
MPRKFIGIEAILGDCSDVRVEPYYDMIADYLDGARKPSPGCKLPASSDFVRLYTDRYRNNDGIIPFLAIPHDSHCAAWNGNGGDEAGFEYADFLIDYLLRHGIPAASLRAIDGHPPIVSHDGLTCHGHSALRDRIREMCADPYLADRWVFHHPARAYSVNVGHHFFRRPYQQILRFTSFYFEEGAEAANTVGRILTLFAPGEVLPVYFSKEVSWRRRREISDLLTAHNLPLDIKVMSA